MYYDVQLDFVREIFKGMLISSTISKNPEEHISNEIDLGLRTLLFKEENYKNILHNSMSLANSKTIYRFFDEYDCNYMFLRLPNEKDEYFFVGPYLLSMPSKERILNKLESVNLPKNLYDTIFQYYSSLPIVEDENILFTIMNTLGKTLWQEDFNNEIIDYMILDRITPIEIFHDDHGEEQMYTLAALEKIYASEKILMKAVSQGKLNKLKVISSSIYNSGIEPRLGDTLRNRKNYLIILKTLLRKAAEYGGVHPFHIDRLSSKYARLIEETRSINEILDLQIEMIQGYCLLVKRHSLSKYSYLVGQAITLISYDLTQDLSLDNISKQLNVNPSYLSSLFHKECGVTLTQYVINMRIDNAAYLLSNTDKLIHTIAYECGISDANYFVKLFKKSTGLTPTQYRKKMSIK